MYGVELRRTKRQGDEIAVRIEDFETYDDLNEAMDVRAHWLITKVLEGGTIYGPEGSEMVVNSAIQRIFTVTVSPL